MLTLCSRKVTFVQATCVIDGKVLQLHKYDSDILLYLLRMYMPPMNAKCSMPLTPPPPSPIKFATKYAHIHIQRRIYRVFVEALGQP